MMKIFFNCKIFKDDSIFNPELVQSQATEINQMKKLVKDLKRQLEIARKLQKNDVFDSKKCYFKADR